MSLNQWTSKKTKLINEGSDKLNARIDRAQNTFFLWLSETFLPSLDTDENEVLIPSDKMLFVPSRLDNYYDKFNEEEVTPIVGVFANDIRKLLGYNQRYYDEVKRSDFHEEIKTSILSSLGITGTIIASGSLLYSILTDREVIAAIKTLVMTGITTGLTVTGLRIALKEVVLKRGGGLIKNLFEERLPDPYVRVDRNIGKKYATSLQLTYAKYQGGTIKTSRDFCIHRNDRVFSRDEILKFGTPQDQFDGYTDKSAGEFQGKTDPYDPIRDLGGYNCRHFLQFISDELAFHLRPELEGRS